MDDRKLILADDRENNGHLPPMNLERTSQLTILPAYSYALAVDHL